MPDPRSGSQFEAIQARADRMERVCAKSGLKNVFLHFGLICQSGLLRVKILSVVAESVPGEARITFYRKVLFLMEVPSSREQQPLSRFSILHGQYP
jgi:hypothetical protein